MHFLKKLAVCVGLLCNGAINAATCDTHCDIKSNEMTEKKWGIVVEFCRESKFFEECEKIEKVLAAMPDCCMVGIEMKSGCPVFGCFCKEEEAMMAMEMLKKYNYMCRMICVKLFDKNAPSEEANVLGADAMESLAHEVEQLVHHATATATEVQATA